MTRIVGDNFHGKHFLFASCIPGVCLFDDTDTNGKDLFFRVLTHLSSVAIGYSVYDKSGCNSNSEWSNRGSHP